MAGRVAPVFAIEEELDPLLLLAEGAKDLPLCFFSDLLPCEKDLPLLLVPLLLTFPPLRAI